MHLVKKFTFYLFENSSLFLYDLDQMYRLLNINSNNTVIVSIPTRCCYRDHIIIELNVPRSESDIVRLNIGTIIHDYEDIMGCLMNTQNQIEKIVIQMVCPGGRGLCIKLMRRFEFQWEEVCVQLPL